MYKRIFPLTFTIFLGLMSSVGFAQFDKDSLIEVTHTGVNDSFKVVTYCNLLIISTPEERTQAEYYLKAGEMLAKKNRSDYLYGEIYRHYAYYSLQKLNNYSAGLKYIKLAMEHYEKIKSDKTLMYCHAFLARDIFEKLGMVDETLVEMKKAVYYAKKTKSHDYIYYLYVLGWFETYNENPDSAFKHLSMAYGLVSQDDRNMQVELLIWMGNTFNAKKDFEKALTYHLKAAKHAEEFQLEQPLIDCYRYSAYSYRSLGRKKEANEYMIKCADYFIKNKRFDRIHYVGSSLITWLSLDKELAKAKKYVDILKDTSEFNYKSDDELRSYVDMALYQYSISSGNYKEAVNYLNDHLVAKDSLAIRKERFKLGELNLRMEFRQQQELDAFEQEKKDLETQSQLQSQKVRTYAFLIGFILVGLLLFLAYRNNKQRQRALKLISVQKKEVEHQKSLVEEKNKEVLDSIHYAKRIQSALLDHEDNMRDYFADYFIYFKPKDIVSGDFYWAATQNPVIHNTFAKPMKLAIDGHEQHSGWKPADRPEQLEDNDAIRKQKEAEMLDAKNNTICFFAVCDSTGHGVPGAFMSLLNIGFLSEAIKEKDIVDPAEVFHYVRSRLTNTISKEGQKDGFDGTLIAFNKSKKAFTYASALNSPLLIREGKAMKLEFDRFPVGKADGMLPFTSREINVKKGDLLYLFTDGYCDQFGGDLGRKFKTSSLEKLLHENSLKSMKEQREIVSSTFAEWKGDYDQLDDVCVIGIKF